MQLDRGEGKYKEARDPFENASQGLLGRGRLSQLLHGAGLTIVGEEAAQFGQTDNRPALLKIADMKPDAMLIMLTSGVPQMTQQFGQLALPFVGIGTSVSSRRMCSVIPARGWIHTQLVTRISPDLNQRSRRSTVSTWILRLPILQNGSQVKFQSMGKVIDEKKALNGENVRARCLNRQLHDDADSDKVRQ